MLLLVFIVITLLFSALFYFSIPTKHCTPPTPSLPQRDDIVTFFYQGNGVSRFQAAQYTGGHPVKAEGYCGSGAYHPRAPLLLHNVYEYPEIPEASFPPSSIYNPLHLLSIATTSFLIAKIGVINAPGHLLSPSLMSFGGNLDLCHHQRYLRRLLSENRSKRKEEKKKIVLFGPSRGASITFVSLCNLSQEELKEISLVVIEAPFDSLPSVIEASLPPLSFLKPIVRRISHFVATNVCAFDFGQESPLEAAEKVSLDVPIAIITSKVDDTVPPQCTQRLIERLRQRGHQKLHLLSLDRSPHHIMSLYDEDDVRKYREFMEDLYERYL